MRAHDMQIEEVKTQQEYLDIPSAAYLAGYTLREFRRIMGEDRIPVVTVNGKPAIGAEDLEAWKSTRGEARFQFAIQQLDRWLKYSPSPEPAEDFDDFD